MRILIAGAGRLGTQIGTALRNDGNDVTLIDQDADRLRHIATVIDLPSVHGDACEPTTLEAAGAHAADLLIAATPDDEDNLVIGLLGKRQFSVARIVARINDPENAWLFDARWGVDVAIPSETPVVSFVEEATGTADTVTLLRLTSAGVTLIETTIAADSRAAGQRLGDVALPAGAITAAVVRGGRAHHAAADWLLQPGDEVLIISETTTARTVDDAFQ